MYVDYRTYFSVSRRGVVLTKERYCAFLVDDEIFDEESTRIYRVIAFRRVGELIWIVSAHLRDETIQRVVRMKEVLLTAVDVRRESD